MDELAVKRLHPRQQRRSCPGRSSNQVSQDSCPAADRKVEALPSSDLTVIHAEERGTPKNRKKIEWKPISDPSVCSRTAPLKLEWNGL
ncbi:hypothetical protein IVB11_27425 [Bradyrhizobium sp. 177]|uniref:hypothetical protein n=1 Tax=Bradyrhizobium sp. 177 TaxID=2782647 RepID=UPI001FF8DEBE|nr:hypothetical protein [Bradyrhizobium sp. 177]MCK1552680.1 hypothetical protein [Bradyrhizobium sp. 177]